MTLADLAVRRPAATRVFWRHQLDFCCGGKQTLADACRKAGLDTDALLAELEHEELGEAPEASWEGRPLAGLIDHILERYHAPLRQALLVLVALARKVEDRHGDKPSCPRGLAAFLTDMQDAVLAHLAKEEQVLFPLILAGRGAAAHMAIRVMNQEHDDHGASLRHLRAVTEGFEPPAEACNSWRALYQGLAELERELMHHIHLENNVLFPRALGE